MDTSNLPPLPGLERISSSCSTSSICTTSTMSSSADTTILSDEHVSNLDYLQLSPSESATTGTTKRRKRQNSVMIIKPTRWSPPVCQGQQSQPQNHHHHHHHNDTNNSYNEKNGTNNALSSTAIDTDFKPTFYNPNEVKHRRRISTYQCSVLEEEYQTNTKPTAAKRYQLAEQLDMTPRTVQIWFQNKRAKAKQHHHHQQQQQKNKPVAPSTCHHSTPKTSISTTKSEASSTSLSATMPLDMFTFDDGRLDPVYLIDDHSAATLPSSVSSPSLSKCGTMLPSNEDDHEAAAVAAPMTGVYDTSMMGNHGTTQLAPAAPAPAPEISSPLLPSSETTGICDAFTMWPHPNDAHHNLQSLPPQDTLPQFSSATTSSSSTPLQQQFSSLDLFSVLQPYQQQSHDTMDGIEQGKNMINSSMDPPSSPRTYSISKQNDDEKQQQQQHQQQHCHDCSFDQPFTQKLSTDPGFGTSMVPTWPYMMNQHAIQNDYLDFVLDQDDWMGPFYACA
ncbi:hypothetical protein BCR42DRAFT_453009 [Absidia repens]|uniref:Homeobox domain-containing protein n=1 Tax=Absidia repens TaxID=90262 RepID=A0A1X2IC47_9FUNG|nr:hypothetical protein BCR42DRAFT_453009 [Absidia repens]